MRYSVRKLQPIQPIDNYQLPIGNWATLERYKKSYGTREKMGKLEFSELTIRKLSSAAVIATGVWRLHRANDQPRGRFTLVIEKKPEGWRITHDHTSSGT